VSFFLNYNWTSSEVYDWCGATPSKCVHPQLKQANDQPTISNYLFGTPGLFGWWKNKWRTLWYRVHQQGLGNGKLIIIAIGYGLFSISPRTLMYMIFGLTVQKSWLSRAKWKHTWNKYGNLSNSVIPVNLAEFLGKMGNSKKIQ